MTIHKVDGSIVTLQMNERELDDFYGTIANNGKLSELRTLIEGYFFTHKTI